VRRSTLALALLTLVSFANYLDRMVLSALAQPIKLEFALSDAVLGLLTGFGFVLLYTVTGVPMARLADRSDRALVLAGALTLWSLATCACGLAGSFAALFVARVFVGIGESGCQPIGYGLIGDYFAPARRTLAIGWFMLGNSLGVAVGFALGGWIGALYGWRAAFIIVGLPGVMLAGALALALPAPPSAQRPPPPRPIGSTPLDSVRALLADSRFRWVLAVNGVYSFLIFGPLTWLPAFFIRSHGLKLATVGTWCGLSIGCGMAVGMLSGGALADRLLRRSVSTPQWFCCATALATGAAYLLVLTAATAPWAFAATFFASLIGSLAAPTNAATVQNLCDPRLRATAASLATLAISLLGIGLAPFVIGALSDVLQGALGPDSLRYAMLAMLPACALTAALHARLARLMQLNPPALAVPA